MIFKPKNPVMKLQNNLADLRQRAERLAAKRTAAQAEFDAAQAARQKFMLQGDLDDESSAAKLQARVDSAASALQGFSDAVTALSAQVVDAERTLAEEQQRVARKTASEKLAREIAVIETKLAPWLAGGRELAAPLESLGALRFEAGAISRFVSNACGEVEVALAVTLADLRGAVTAIAAGGEEIPRPPQPVPVIVPPPKPETQNLFFLRHARYRAADGKPVLIAKFTDHETPPAIAARAVALGVATAAMDDPRRKRYLVQGSAPPNIEWTTSIDDDEAELHDVVTHSAFQKLDRGPAFTIRVPRGPEPEPMAAARSIDSGDIEER